MEQKKKKTKAGGMGAKRQAKAKPQTYSTPKEYKITNSWIGGWREKKDKPGREGESIKSLARHAASIKTMGTEGS